METWLVLVVAALAGVAGLAAGYLLAQGRALAARRDLDVTRIRAEEQARQVPDLTRRIEEQAIEIRRLSEEAVRRAKDAENAADKVRWLEQAEAQLKEAFQALAAQALQSNADEYLKRTRDQLDGVAKQLRGDWGVQKEQVAGLVQPLDRTLKALDEKIAQLEEKRQHAYGSLDKHLAQLQTAFGELRGAASGLATALTTSSRSRGSWGEIELRRIVELAGLTPHVDFQEQTRQDENQPDMLIHMPNNAVLPVDAKTTLQSFREVAEASDDAARKLKLKAHAAVLKGRIAELSRKEYWRQFEGRNPEFVVLFLPHEGFLSAAFEGDPAILEAAFKERILLVTPITLLALLRTVAYGWQQRAMTENAREIADQGRELHERARIFLEHIAKLGGAIEATTRQYNQAIGSLETRLMPTLRKLKDLGAGAADLPEPATADTQPRLPRAEPGPS